MNIHIFPQSICFLALGLFASSSAFALYDPDGDQISEIFEAHYGVSFETNHVDPKMRPDGDLDGDGYTNIEESRLGTDPTSASSGLVEAGPSGRFTTQSTYLPNDHFDVVFHGIRGVEYSLKYTSTLSGWVLSGSPFEGEGFLEYLNVDASASMQTHDRSFLSIFGDTALDSDLDTLTNYEESLIGTHRYSADHDGDGNNDLAEYLSGIDSDGDGIDSATEIANGTDPNNWDSDGDGLSDLFENNQPTDPLVQDNPDHVLNVYTPFEN